MNSINKLYEWISWDTSTHYLVTSWNGSGTFIENKWVKK
jgi:hypothetical protein